MTQQDVVRFEKIQAQLEGLHIEISSLSKKSQNDALNKFKLKFVNEVISEANALLGSNYKPFTDFDQFDEVDIPTNSDAALILNQYLTCLEKLRADNIKQTEYSYKWYWMLNSKLSDIETTAPKKLKEK